MGKRKYKNEEERKAARKKREVVWHRKYYEKHREERLAYQKEYQKRNPYDIEEKMARAFKKKLRYRNDERYRHYCCDKQRFYMIKKKLCNILTAIALQAATKSKL